MWKWIKNRFVKRNEKQKDIQTVNLCLWKAQGAFIGKNLKKQPHIQGERWHLPVTTELMISVRKINSKTAKFWYSPKMLSIKAVIFNNLNENCSLHRWEIYLLGIAEVFNYKNGRIMKVWSWNFKN